MGKSVVITGSTRGIGLGLAEEFLRRGHQVTVCGRSEESTAKAVESLAAKHGGANVLGVPCDVGEYAQVEKLWATSTARFGKVDIWINNAGLSHARQPLWEIPPERNSEVVKTNVLGVMYGSRVAIRGMLKQGSGQLYNMEGLGSSGKPTKGLLLYGATKSALTYLTQGLIAEVEGMPVQVGFLSPGIVVTDLLTEGYTPRELAKVKRIFNILADKVETVTPFLVEGILANDRNGSRIAWLTRGKAFWRFLTAGFNRRDLFAEGSPRRS